MPSSHGRRQRRLPYNTPQKRQVYRVSKFFLSLGCIVVAIGLLGLGIRLYTDWPHFVNMLSFAFGLQNIAKQQAHLAQTIKTGLQDIRLPLTSYQRENGSVQRRGREQWQWQLHRIQLPSEATLATCDFFIRKTASQAGFTVFDRHESQATPNRVVELSVGISDAPTDFFVLTYNNLPSSTVLSDRPQQQPAPAPPPSLPPLKQPAPPPPLSLPLLKQRPSPPALPSPPLAQPQIAIVIDDLGWDLEAARTLFTLDAPLSFAILPDTPHGSVIAREARQRGRDVLLHLPMEPHGYPQIDPGQHALLGTMSKEVFSTRLSTALASMPQALGVNNHMGSRLTENQDAMAMLMHQIKQRNLFFLDSRTSEKSLAYQVAQTMRVPAAQRHIFLDHDINTDKIAQQLQRLSAVASQQGFAIAIAHPYPETLQVLQKNLSTLRHSGYEIVPVSRLVK